MRIRFVGTGLLETWQACVESVQFLRDSISQMPAQREKRCCQGACCFDLACRWKYGLETFPWKIEENSLKIAVLIMEDVWTPWTPCDCSGSGTCRRSWEGRKCWWRWHFQGFLGTRTKGTPLRAGGRFPWARFQQAEMCACVWVHTQGSLKKQQVAEDSCWQVETGGKRREAVRSRRCLFIGQSPSLLVCSRQWNTWVQTIKKKSKRDYNKSYFLFFKLK